MKAVIAGCTSLLFVIAATANAQRPPEFTGLGTWINPKRTAIMETKPCGDALCGTVVWATPESQEKAREQGVGSLVGMELLSNYRRTASAEWQGEVFVPALGRRVFSRLDQLGPDRLKISGCVLDGMICRAQVWTRTSKLRPSA